MSTVGVGEVAVILESDVRTKPHGKHVLVARSQTLLKVSGGLQLVVCDFLLPHERELK